MPRPLSETHPSSGAGRASTGQPKSPREQQRLRARPCGRRPARRVPVRRHGRVPRRGAGLHRGRARGGRASDRRTRQVQDRAPEVRARARRRRSPVLRHARAREQPRASDPGLAPGRRCARVRWQTRVGHRRADSGRVAARPRSRSATATRRSSTSRSTTGRRCHCSVSTTPDHSTPRSSQRRAARTRPSSRAARATRAPSTPGSTRRWAPSRIRLPDPRTLARTVVFGTGELAEIRRLVARRAHAAGLAPGRREDVVLAVNELATNSIRHGGGSGVLRVWREPEVLICEVARRRSFRGSARRAAAARRHAGRRLRALAGQPGLRSRAGALGAGGSTVRVHMRSG